MDLKRTKVMFAIGTRPEAIKLAPLIRACRDGVDSMQVQVIATAQHRYLLDQVFDLYGIKPEYDLDIMTPGQTPADVNAELLRRLVPILSEAKPDLLIVHGDTTTSMAASMAAFYAGVPVAHVEAGLRTGDLRAPWPEEMNRRVTAQLAGLHFAPTERAKANLLAEGVPEANIEVTGNTVVDALLDMVERLKTDSELRKRCEAALPSPTSGKRMILVTNHRREHFGAPQERIFLALRTLAARSDVEIVFPVHPNPAVRGPTYEWLEGIPNVRLIEPQDYAPFVELMRRSYLIITDSGGLQEEAPSLGKPVLVTREATERPEAIEAGTARLVGSETETIVAAANRLLDDEAHYRRMATIANPYGDGQAAARISERIRRFLARH